MGDGIFTVDGPKWSASRALLRPQFHKQRISDLDLFEEHIQKMISLLPQNGETIEMLGWWYRFTMDANTEYLFGETVGSLDNPKVDQKFSDMTLGVLCRSVRDNTEDSHVAESYRAFMEILLACRIYVFDESPQ
jgi:cytochrome P450